MLSEVMWRNNRITARVLETIFAKGRPSKFWHNLPSILLYIVGLVFFSVLISILLANFVPPTFLAECLQKVLSFVPLWYTNQGLSFVFLVSLVAFLSYSRMKACLGRFLNTIFIAPNNVLVSPLAVLFLVLWITARAGNGFDWAFVQILLQSFLVLGPYLLTFGLSLLCVATLDLVYSIVSHRFALLDYKAESVIEKPAKRWLDDVSDEPIAEEREDILGRDDFVESVYDQINSLPFDSPFVFAVQGGWGEGKTSVLNLLRNKLSRNKRYIIIDFNPWYFSSGQGLLENFLRDFELAINTCYLFSNFRSTLAKYKRLLLSPLKRSFPFVTEGLSGIFHEETLEQVKYRLVRILEAVDKKIVILIDDVDRLQKEEMREVLRLVKLLSNFPKTVFILSFDQAKVNNALKEDFKTDNEFLEKVVQKVLPLPKIDQFDIDRYFEAQLNVATAGVKLSLEERAALEKKFKYFYQSKLRRIFNTLRKTKRYFNSLRATISSRVAGEISLYDFLILEALRVFYPEIFEDVWYYRWYYINHRWDNESLLSAPFGISFKGEAIKKATKKHISALVSSYPVEEGTLIIDLLAELFLPVKNAFHQPNYVYDSLAKSCRTEKRVTHPVVFRRYFMLRDRPGMISDTEVATLVTLLNATNPNEISSTLRDTLDGYRKVGKLLEILDKLDLFIDKFSPKIAEVLVKAIYGYADRLPNKLKRVAWENEYTEAFVLMYRLINEKVDKGSAHKVVIDIVKNAPIFYAVRVVEWATSKEPAFINVKGNVDAPVLRKELANRLSQKYLAEKGNVFETDAGIRGYVLTQWVLLGEKEKRVVNNYVFGLIRKHPEYIGQLLNGFVAHWAGGQPQIRYDDLIRVYYEKEIIDAVRKIDVDRLKSEEERTALNLFLGVYADKHKSGSKIGGGRKSTGKSK